MNNRESVIQYLKDHIQNVFLQRNDHEQFVLSTDIYEVGDALDDFLVEILDVDCTWFEHQGESWIFTFQDPSPEIKDKIISNLRALGSLF